MIFAILWRPCGKLFDIYKNYGVNDLVGCCGTGMLGSSASGSWIVLSILTAIILFVMIFGIVKKLRKSSVVTQRRALISRAVIVVTRVFYI